MSHERPIMDGVNIIQPNLDRPFDTFRHTSIPLPGGGDTHIHPLPDTSVVVTTRLPGGIEPIHDIIKW